MLSEIVDIIVYIFLVFGVFFNLLAGVGLLRFPDVYTRLHAGTKCTTFGSIFICGSVILLGLKSWIQGNTDGVTSVKFGTKSGTRGISGCNIRSAGSCKYDLTATSANISGNKPIYNIAEVKKTLSDIDLIIDAGTLPRRVPSTVYDPYKKKILRKGKVNLKQIEKVMK